jgi:hypothetical protein
VDTRPRLFLPGTLFDSNTYERIRSSVFNPKYINDTDEDDDDDDDVSDNELFDEQALNNQREHEIQHLSQLIRANQPKDDYLANIIMQQLDDDDDDDILESTMNNDNDNNNQTQSRLQTSSIIVTTTQHHPYPPVNQTGPVEDHDRPYADYGHLNRQTIAQECQFNLQPSSTSTSHQQQQSIRLHAKSFAITSWTNVSKDLVMSQIKDEFGIENIQYICISEEISELNHQPHLHIQIILKEKVDRRKPFLDEITQTHCNYQVTQNDLAWNEYIKKAGNYIEFNEFKSTKTRGQKQWPSPSLSSTATSASSALPMSTTIIDNNQPLVPRTTTTTTVRAQAEERRKHEADIARQALNLAETSVHRAMDLIRRSMPTKFLNHCSWYERISRDRF